MYFLTDACLVGRMITLKSKAKVYQQSVSPAAILICAGFWIFRETASELDHEAKSSLLQGFHCRQFLHLGMALSARL